MAKDKKPRSENQHKYNKLGSIVWMMKKLWKIQKRLIIFMLLAIPVAVAFPLLESYFAKVLIDQLGMGVSFADFTVTCVGFIVLLCLLKLLNEFMEDRCYARQFYPTMLCHREINRFSSYETDYENLEKEDYKRIMDYVEYDASRGNCSMEYTWQDISDTLKNAFGIFSYTSLLGFMNPMLFVVILFVSVISYLTSRWQAAYEETHKHEWAKETRKIKYLSGLSEDFQMAKDIKLYALEGWLSGMHNDYQAYVLMWTKRCNLRGGAATVLAGFMTLLQDGAAYFVLIGLLFAGDITVGDFVFYFGLVTGIAAFLREIIGNIATLSERADKIANYRDLFSYPSHFNRGEGCPIPEGAVTIECKDVWYKYLGAEDYTLKGVNLSMKAGESIALVGMNGAGKSTLVKLLCGMYTPEKGEILVNGKKISEYNVEDYYSMISAVFQETTMAAFTILEFVSSADLERKTAKEDVKRALKMAGLWEKIEGLPSGINTHLVKGIYDDAVELSGGELQKLLLARAIYKDGSILILDEPTAALDPIAENNLYLQYRELTRGKTSLYISHRFASTRFCDRIVLLENGVITENGTHEELMEKNGQYAYMFGVQSKYYQDEIKDENEENGGLTYA